MNKSNLFKSAWKLAREAQKQFGGKVKEYFALSLKEIYAQNKGKNMKEFKIFDQDGNLDTNYLNDEFRFKIQREKGDTFALSNIVKNGISLHEINPQDPVVFKLNKETNKIEVRYNKESLLISRLINDYQLNDIAEDIVTSSYFIDSKIYKLIDDISEEDLEFFVENFKIIQIGEFEYKFDNEKEVLKYKKELLGETEKANAEYEEEKKAKKEKEANAMYICKKAKFGFFKGSENQKAWVLDIIQQKIDSKKTEEYLIEKLSQYKTIGKVIENRFSI